MEATGHWIANGTAVAVGKFATFGSRSRRSGFGLAAVNGQQRQLYRLFPAQKWEHHIVVASTFDDIDPILPESKSIAAAERRCLGRIHVAKT